MIEYNISLIFNKVWSIFSNRKGEKKTKMHLFELQNSFFQKLQKWSDYYMWYVFWKVFSWRKQHNNHFCKILKIGLFRDQKPFLLFLQFFPFFEILHCKGQFSIFFIFDKNSESYISRPFNRHITSKNLKIFEGMTKKFI